MPPKSKSIEQISPPLPLETLESYASDIFTPIKRGESVTTIWVPMAGRRIRNKFIISYPELFKKSVGDLSSYLLVYIEPLELTEESRAGYVKLIIQTTIDSLKEKTGEKLNNPDTFYSTGDYSELLGHLKELLKEVTGFGLEIILFLGEFDEMGLADSILYNNLKSLWVSLQGKLHFVFLFQQDLNNAKRISEFGDLNELLLKNIVYVPLMSQDDTNYLIDYFGKELNRDFSEDEKKLLFEVCGGHPYFIKAATRLIALENGHKQEREKLKHQLISHFELHSTASHLLELLSEDEVLALKEIVSNKKSDLPESLKSLEKLRMVILRDDVWIPFCELFLSVIRNGETKMEEAKVDETRMIFEEKNGSIYVFGTNVEDKFTLQEYEILRFLLSDPEKLRSRDEIGDAMWGKQSYEKYSDWAIDQVMSKIRKKLALLGAEKSLVTVRGRGYKLDFEKN